jgi:hypothetical protein
MKKLGVLLLMMLGCAVGGRAQNFLVDYQRHLKQSAPGHKPDRLAELQLLREVLAAHRQRTGRNLATADTISVVTLTPAEVNGYAPSAGIVWSRTDTVAFRLQYAYDHEAARRTITYEPFLQLSLDTYADFGQDSLVALVSQRQFVRAQQLARENHAFDGSRSRIVSAVKAGKRYQITTLTLPAFGLFRFPRSHK